MHTLARTVRRLAERDAGLGGRPRVAAPGRWTPDRHASTPGSRADIVLLDTERHATLDRTCARPQPGVRRAR